MAEKFLIVEANFYTALAAAQKVGAIDAIEAAALAMTPWKCLAR